MEEYAWRGDLAGEIMKEESPRSSTCGITIAAGASGSGESSQQLLPCTPKDVKKRDFSDIFEDVDHFEEHFQEMKRRWKTSTLPCEFREDAEEPEHPQGRVYKLEHSYAYPVVPLELY